MRTQDRTYTNQIAFGEKDRKDPDHDDICTYLSQRSKVEKLVFLLNRINPDDVGHMELDSTTRLSAALFRDSYQSQFIAGYADVLFKYDLTYGKKGVEHHDDEIAKAWRELSESECNAKYYDRDRTAPSGQQYTLKKEYNLCNRVRGEVLVEVKKHKVNINKILQQFNTYRPLSSDLGEAYSAKMVLATPYSIGKYEQSLLLRHGIRHIFIDMGDVKEFITNDTIAEQESF